MRFNALMVQKALNSLSNAVYYMAQAIEPCAEDIVGYNALLKAKQALSGAGGPQQPAKPDAQKAQRPSKQEKASEPKPDKGVKDDLKALREDLAKEARKEKPRVPDRDERGKAISEAIRRTNGRSSESPAGQADPNAAAQSSLPDKPMRIVTMNEFLKGWTERAKARPIRSCGGFAAGMNCSYQGVEHSIKAVYSNGVALVNRKATQYQRLVPVERLEALFPKDTGSEGKYSTGQKVYVGFGMKSDQKATSFRQAVLGDVHGNAAFVKYSDTGTTSSVRLSCLRPCRS